jgi:hypothetical protein
MLRVLNRILARFEDGLEPIYFTESREERLARLKTDDPVVARELLEEARRLHESTSSTLESVERRASTLQGVVSIAATVAVAGAALMVDPGKVQGLGWRLVLACLFGLFLYCLIATAYRATQSSTQIHTWTREDPSDHLQRTTRPALEVDAELSADLLYAFGQNTEVVRWKVSYLRAASEWFARALISLGLIAVAVLAYVIFNGDGTTTAEPATKPMIRIDVGKVQVDPDDAVPMPVPKGSR